MLRFMLLASLLFVVLLASTAWGQAPLTGPPSNAELAELHQADQADRRGVVDWAVVAPRDQRRRERALELLASGDVRTATDYYHAAMVFQHGQTFEDIRNAHALATVATALDPGNKSYRWLVAASWDRMLMHRIQPQWYGTQYQGDDRGTYLFPVAEGVVDDAERERMGVPSLAQARGRLAEMAEAMGQAPHPQPPTIEDLQARRSGAPADTDPPRATDAKGE